MLKRKETKNNEVGVVHNFFFFIFLIIFPLFQTPTASRRVCVFIALFLFVCYLLIYKNFTLKKNPREHFVKKKKSR